MKKISHLCNAPALAVYYVFCPECKCYTRNSADSGDG